MDRIRVQLLQGSALVQLSLVLQDMVHVLRQLGIETLSDLAWFADCSLCGQLYGTHWSGHDQHKFKFRLTSAALDNNVVECMFL